ncbi:MAG: MFS transporter [Anaerolineales bacterium]|nr:MFS transporter [Anaerolineales bacterium]
MLKRAIRWYDYITINIYYLGLTTLAQTNGLILPILVQDFVGESQQGAFYGTIRLYTLMVALLAQSIMGMVSDHSSFRWGRRRPFIFIGTFFNLVFITAIGFTLGMEGMRGFWFLFTIAILLQISTNTAHAAQQGLIPDLVPEEKRGRFSGFKAVLELPLPLLLVSFTIARVISAGNLLGGILLAAGILVIVMVITMFVPEKPLQANLKDLDWKPFLRLFLMTGLFTSIILGSGKVVNIIGQYLEPLQSPLQKLVLMGLVGLFGIIIAIGAGVLFSVRISLGRDARLNPSFLWWVINRLAYLAGVINLSAFAIFFIQARLGYIRETAAGPVAILLLIVGAFVFITALPSGWLSDRFGNKKLVVLSGALAGLGTFIAILTPNLIVIYLGGSLIGIATGIFYTANWALGTELVPKKESGRYLGISNLAGAGAGAIGAYIGGPIADYFTFHHPDMLGIGYVLLFAIFGVLFLLSIAPILLVKVPPSH